MSKTHESASRCYLAAAFPHEGQPTGALSSYPRSSHLQGAIGPREGPTQAVSRAPGPPAQTYKKSINLCEICATMQGIAMMRQIRWEHYANDSIDM
eukprot:8934763-Alexandrium_andersonii.AAC.1